MAKVLQGATYGFVLGDAECVLKAVNRHWAEVKAFGGEEQDKKDLANMISEAGAILEGALPEQNPLEAARHTLRDRLGPFRRASELVANGRRGKNRTAYEALKLKGTSLGTDAQLRDYVKSIGTRMKPYSAMLARYGFSKDAQAAVVEESATFLKALTARGRARGQAKASRVERDALFTELKALTSYLRRIGRNALYGSPARAEFDRVKLDDRPAKKAQTPAQGTGSSGKPVAAVA